MKPRVVLSAILLGLAAFSVSAGAPNKSMRPVLRPDQGNVSRPDFLVLATSALGLRISLRPVLRPRGLRSGNQPQSHPIPVAVTARGSVCGIGSIKGEKLARIRGRLAGCGVKNPVRISSIDGVALSQGAIMDCTTAKALNSWVKNGVKPTVGRLGGGVASLQVLAHYSCRTRNSQPGAKISEHGKGRAIDISAINLNNGASLNVLNGWKDRAQGKLLKNIHRVACGPFGTVLGPNSDRFHRDHFHLDTARYRGGSYCR